MRQHEKQLEIEVRELLVKAQKMDEEEDSRYGKGKREDELPQELALRMCAETLCIRLSFEVDAGAP